MPHEVTEAKKFHNLLSTSWRIRKAGGIVQYKPKGLRTRGADHVTPSPGLQGLRTRGPWYKSWSWKAQEPGASMSDDRKRCSPRFKKREFLLPPFFCSVQALNRWDGAAHIGGGRSLYSVCGIKFQFLPVTPSWIHPEIMFN